ncbi:hypothetical protein HO173_003372 [Letharia columbiana]|uniref:Uncharacterized protein n=1 Tax=Letharia columbiana TaxID=112416 RepID=A0A8H6L7J8_9LECA|nr:uncharacterized protein HO173_003372 [Letharia columbiana]KAF6238405.1 hypothetical protein HO173_003372 [Letharia columbiana]
MWHIGELSDGVITVGMRLTRIYKEETDFKLTREPHEYIMAPYANIHAHGNSKPARTQGRSLHRYQTSETSVETKPSPESATGDGLFPCKITTSNLLNPRPPQRKLRCPGVKCASKAISVHHVRINKRRGRWRCLVVRDLERGDRFAKFCGRGSA